MEFIGYAYIQANNILACNKLIRIAPMNTNTLNCLHGKGMRLRYLLIAVITAGLLVAPVASAEAFRAQEDVYAETSNSGRATEPGARYDPAAEKSLNLRTDEPGVTKEPRSRFSEITAAIVILAVVATAVGILVFIKKRKR